MPLILFPVDGLAVEKRTQVLIMRAQGGDRSAFDELVSLYRPLVQARVKSRLGSRLRCLVEVQDIVQETFTQAFAMLEGFKWQKGDSFRAWLYTIVDNVIRSLLRKRTPKLLALTHDPPADNLTASHLLRREERFDRLEQALRTLSADQRQVLLLARIEGLPIRIIAERIGRSQGAVKQLLSRGLKKLRATFDETESLHLPADRRLGDEL